MAALARDGGTDDLLLLAPTRRAAGRLRDQLAQLLPVTVGRVLVRTPASFAFSVRASYLMGLRTGEFGGRVPLEQPHGLDALAVVEYRLLDWLDLNLRGGLTLLWLRLAPLAARPDDDPAGVRDRYLSLGLGARARL